MIYTLTQSNEVAIRHAMRLAMAEMQRRLDALPGLDEATAEDLRGIGSDRREHVLRRDMAMMAAAVETMERQFAPQFQRYAAKYAAGEIKLSYLTVVAEEERTRAVEQFALSLIG